MKVASTLVMVMWLLSGCGTPEAEVSVVESSGDALRVAPRAPKTCVFHQPPRLEFPPETTYFTPALASYDLREDPFHLRVCAKHLDSLNCDRAADYDWKYWSYDRAGHLIEYSREAPLIYAASFTYDPAGRCLSSRVRHGHWTSTTSVVLDADGTILSGIDGWIGEGGSQLEEDTLASRAKNCTSLVYDLKERDSLANSVTVGRRTELFDNQGWPVRTEWRDGNDALVKTQSFSPHVSPPGTKRYDAQNRIVWELSPEGATTTSTYDHRGLLLERKRTSQSSEVTQTFHYFGRGGTLLESADSVERDVGAGLPTSPTSSPARKLATIQFRYQGGRVVSESVDLKSDGTIDEDTVLTYDAKGRVTARSTTPRILPANGCPPYINWRFTYCP